jgi:hypothetical protein
MEDLVLLVQLRHVPLIELFTQQPALLQQLTATDTKCFVLRLFAHLSAVFAANRPLVEQKVLLS